MRFGNVLNGIVRFAICDLAPCNLVAVQDFTCFKTVNYNIVSYKIVCMTNLRKFRLREVEAEDHFS